MLVHNNQYLAYLAYLAYPGILGSLEVLANLSHLENPESLAVLVPPLLLEHQLPLEPPWHLEVQLVLDCLENPGTLEILEDLVYPEHLVCPGILVVLVYQ
jgi:hypothetical protein